MKTKHISILSIVFLFLSIVFTMNAVSMDETIENHVDAVFNVEMVSATDFRVNVELMVHRIMLSGSGITYTYEEINTLSDLTILGAIEQELKVLLMNIIKESFKNAEVSSLNVLPAYKNERFYDDFIVNLTSVFFGLNKTVNVYDVVNGLLDTGGVITYGFNLQAEPGWNNTFVFDLNNKYSLSRTNGEYDYIENTIQWSIKNWNGNKQNIEAELSMKDKNPTTIGDKEDIFIQFLLDAEGKTTTLQSDVFIKKLDVTGYNMIPDFINLTCVTADGLRLLIQNNLTTWDEIYEKTIKTIMEKIKTAVETKKFNQTLDLKFNWDNTTTTQCPIPYDVEEMNEKPAVKAVLKDDDVDLEIYNISARGMFGLVNAGAVANVTESSLNFGDNLNSIGYPYNVTILMPEGVYLDGKNPYIWNDTIEFTGEFTSDNPPYYTKEDKNIVVNVDIKNADLNLLSFFTGKTELTFELDSEEVRNYNVTELPEDFSLPTPIHLKKGYLNSDAFRLCIQENVFKKKDIDMFLDNGKKTFENRISWLFSGLEVIGNVNRDVFEKSVNLDVDVTKMDDHPPVKVAYYAHSSYPVSFNLSFIPPGFEIPVQNYSFTGLKNQSITYRIVFPHGVDIEVDDVYGKANVGETSDGRNYFEISFTPMESNLSVEVSCKMIPSLLFIIGVFTPCLISLAITIVFIFVIFIIRRKRRKRVVPVVEKESVGYEDSEYYVPPPPPSRSK